MKNLIKATLAALILSGPAWALPPQVQAPPAQPAGAPGQVQVNLGGGQFGALTGAQVTALINPFTSSFSGTVPASGGGTTNFLRADGTWAAPPAGSGGLPLTGGTLTGTLHSAGIADSGGINTTALTGFQMLGINAYFATVASPETNASIAVGPGAGAALPAGTALNTFVGAGSGNVFTTGGEASCGGALSCNLLVTGGFDTAWGQHAIGHEVASSGLTALGSDSQRNSMSVGTTGFNTTTGKNTLYSGGLSFATANGAFSLMGNSAMVQITGTATAGDTISLTFTGTFSGSPVTTAPITINAGETPAQMATALLNAVNSTTIIAAPAVDANTTTSQVIDTSNIRFGFIGSSTSGNDIVITSTVTGAQTEILTTTGGSVGPYLNASGYEAMECFYCTTASSDFAEGRLSLYAATSAISDIAMGDSAAIKCNSCSRNVIFGDGSAPTLVGGSGNFIGGYKADVAQAGTFDAVAIGGNTNSGQRGAVAGNTSVTIGAVAGLPGSTVTSSDFIGFNVGSAGNCSAGLNIILIAYSSAVDCPAPNTDGWINIANAIFVSNQAPAISGFGTGAAVVAGTSTAGFAINVGAGGTASSGRVTIHSSTGPAPNGWICSAVDITNPASSNTVATPVNATQFDLTNYSRTTGALTAWAASDIIAVSCNGY